MNVLKRIALTASVLLLAASAWSQTAHLKRDAGGYPAPTTALERGRTIFVQSSCHFCHGVDLTQASMGAADLLHSPLVGADVDGNLIGAIVLAGLPNLQTAMPRYKDLTQQQILELAGYVHFLRQQGRYKELMAATDQQPGDAATGKTYFEGKGGCRSCHADKGDLVGIAKRYDDRMLRSHLLLPSNALPKEGVTPSPGVQAHLKLLENYSSSIEVQNLIAYLHTMQ